MSHEKSQLENITIPPQGGNPANKNKPPSDLPAGFSLGRQLTTKDKPTPRSKTLNYFLPDYPSGIDRDSQEEREGRMWMEKEGMNYDLYLLIKEKLAPEFQEKLDRNIPEYDDLKKNNLFELIEENPYLYTPNPKDIQFITNNLKEFFPKVKEDGYPYWGIFINSFIHAYFNSVPEEKREGLKLFLANTDELDFIGAELFFGSLKVKEAGNFFGRQAHGSAILEAERVGSDAGTRVYENAHLIIKEARNFFGYHAHGSAILEAQKVRDKAGEEAYENAHLIIKEAGDQTGMGMRGDATITITEKYNSIGGNRKDNSKIVLPDGRVLMPGDSV